MLLRRLASPLHTDVETDGIMSNNGNSTLYNGSSSWGLDRRRCLQHDLRHALFTLRTGIALLGQVRDDPERTAELQQLLEHEVATASTLVDELLQRPDLTAQ
jgi:hypothetical protein